MVRPDPYQLEEEALYLGALAATGIKPLSRIEYPVSPAVLDRFAAWGLVVASVTRFARDGTRCRHLILSRQPALIAAYRARFDRTVIAGETPAVVRCEARFFGYPACCAEAFIQAPYGPNDLAPDEQGLLFHHACPGCRVTPRLLLRYRTALAWARRQHRLLRGCSDRDMILSPLR